MIKCKAFIRSIVGDQSAQVLPLAALGLAALLGIAGLTIDMGHAYVVRNELQASTNAAALAAVQSVYVSTSDFNPTATVQAFGAGAGGSNYGGLTTTSANVQSLCLKSLLPSGTGTCSSTSGVNAVRVTQTASAATYFLKAVGISSIPISTTSTAALQLTPWNVAVVVDATGSMSTTDSNCGSSSPSEFQCAMMGLQTLMAAANPCPRGASSCNDASSIFRLALFSFPNLSESTVATATTCSGSLNWDMYTLPPSTATTYSSSGIEYQTTGKNPQSWQATYQITPFESDYYLPTASNGLNSSAPLVKAVTGCMYPISKPGTGTGGLQGASQGGITYFAGAIYAAQAALLAEQANHPGSMNAIILLSDGQANLKSATGDFPTSYTANPTSSGLSSLYSNGSYPSAIDECQQAIKAANDVAVAGTRVYAVAYGSEQTGCTGSAGTDSTLIANSLSLNVPLTSLSSVTPCVTMEDIASKEAYFYSDYKQSGSNSLCQSSVNTVTSLQSIFGSIVGSFSSPKLVPNSAT